MNQKSAITKWKWELICFVTKEIKSAIRIMAHPKWVKELCVICSDYLKKNPYSILMQNKPKRYKDTLTLEERLAES